MFGFCFACFVLFHKTKLLRYSKIPNCILNLPAAILCFLLFFANPYTSFLTLALSWHSHFIFHEQNGSHSMQPHSEAYCINVNIYTTNKLIVVLLSIFILQLH